MDDLQAIQQQDPQGARPGRKAARRRASFRPPALLLLSSTRRASSAAQNTCALAISAKLILVRPDAPLRRPAPPFGGAGAVRHARCLRCGALCCPRGQLEHCLVGRRAHVSVRAAGCRLGIPLLQPAEHASVWHARADGAAAGSNQLRAAAAVCGNALPAQRPVYRHDSHDVHSTHHHRQAGFSCLPWQLSGFCWLACVSHLGAYACAVGQAAADRHCGQPKSMHAGCFQVWYLCCFLPCSAAVTYLVVHFRGTSAWSLLATQAAGGATAALYCLPFWPVKWEILIWVATVSTLSGPIIGPAVAVLIGHRFCPAFASGLRDHGLLGGNQFVFCFSSTAHSTPIYREY